MNQEIQEVRKERMFDETTLDYTQRYLILSNTFESEIQDIV